MKGLRKTTGLPDVIDAFHEALGCHGQPERFSWSHSLVYQAACKTGFSILRLSPPQESFQTFSQFYNELKDNLLSQLADPINNPLSQIDQLSRDMELDPALLYYLTKPAGSYMRQYMRQKSMGSLTRMNREIALPL
jgi:hypothetical protein